jgi:hypothetical protein
MKSKTKPSDTPVTDQLRKHLAARKPVQTQSTPTKLSLEEAIARQKQVPSDKFN